MVLAWQHIRAVTIALGIITVFGGLGVAPDARAQPRTLKSGQVFTECANCPEMVVVPAGTFMMGSPDDEKDRQRDEGPVHRVEIKQPFALGRFEITLDQFAAFVQELALQILAGKHHHVEHVVHDRRSRRSGVLQGTEGWPALMNATISPSITVSFGSFASALTTSGYLALKSLSFRDRK